MQKDVKIIDIKEEFIKNSTPNVGEIILQDYYEHNGVKYYVNNKQVKRITSQAEYDTASWLKRNFGGRIEIIPQVNFPLGIQTPDFIFNNNRYDIKTITGKGETVIYQNIRGKEKQASNFVVDISRSEISIENAINQIETIYKRDNMQWLEVIMLKKGNDLLKIFKKQ